jgi:broad specificity phosphatase PhoE
MSTLTVVRHGQASFLADDYDRLSELGERQARLLGDYWVRHRISFDCVVYGPCERQIRTGEIVGDVVRGAGLPWPVPAIDPDLDEFPAELVVRTFLPELRRRYPHLDRAVNEFVSTDTKDVKRRIFDKVLREVSQRWLSGEVSRDEIPTWKQFCQRVEAAIGRVKLRTPKSGHSVVFTSGGPTAATARAALGLSYESTLELTWSPKNASYSEFLFTADRFSLSTFNNTPHLAGPDLITYR